MKGQAGARRGQGRSGNDTLVTLLREYFYPCLDFHDKWGLGPFEELRALTSMEKCRIATYHRFSTSHGLIPIVESLDGSFPNYEGGRICYRDFMIVNLLGNMQDFVDSRIFFSYSVNISSLESTKGVIVFYYYCRNSAFHFG